MAEKDNQPEFKVCGLTLESDVAACCRLGVSYIGFNLYPKSKRFVALAEAVELWRQGHNQDPSILPTTRPTVVMVDPGLDDIEAVVQQFPELVALQLHGHETETFLAEAKKRIGAGRQLWQARRVTDLSSVREATSQDVDLVLYDAPQLGEELGGTGQVFDWEKLKQRSWQGRFGIAGGVSVANVAEVLDFQPDLIDVCSKVEVSPGKKDIEAIEVLEKKIRGQ